MIIDSCVARACALVGPGLATPLLQFRGIAVVHWLGNSIFDVKLAAVPLFLGFVILSSYTIWQFEAKKKVTLFDQK